MSFFQKIFGSKNDRYLKKLRPLVQKINALEPEVEKLADEEFPQRMAEYRQAVQEGSKTLDGILPEVFALVREAAKRTLGMRHFDVQLIGGIVLHKGRIAEMKTGEGKTLVATLAVSLNALSGKGVHVVTVNDYLAQRDAAWMGKVYSFLGLTTGVIVHDLDDNQRRAAYAADITYGTNNEFGFDYLRDNMKFYATDLVQRGHNFAIVDEVDSILIDEARTPLIISGASDEDVDLYQAMDAVVCQLDPDDYSVDEKAKTATLTEKGVAHCEELTHLDNLFDPRNMLAQHHILQSLKAHCNFKRDVDYIVQNDEVVIVDEFTGRIMPGRRYSDGLHQALEAKEHVRIQAENQTLASITFQNYFRMYDKLAGMTGTADTEAVEFHEIYNLEVMTIPTNRPMIRKDYPDLIYQTRREKFDAIVETIRELYQTGQPVLVGTISIETSEMLSARLKKIGIPHSVLNAKHHAQEAEIIAKAGEKGHVTIATNMAGRGTDIVLGEGVRELGGLHILGTERHESRRIDNQLRGRAGRQGDPGSSRFYLSLEDNLMRLFGSDRIKGLMGKLGLKDGEAIENNMVSRAVENAQKKVEAHHFEIRKTLLDYDNVMNQQREVIYALRRDAMQAKDLTGLVCEFRDDLLNDIYNELESGSGDNLEETRKSVRAQLEEYFQISRVLAQDAPLPDIEETRKLFMDILAQLKDELAMSFQAVGNEEEARLAAQEEGIEYEEYVARNAQKSLDDILRYVVLEELDRCWKEHLRNMDALRDGIGLRGYGQRDPKLEYKREGFLMFENLLIVIRQNIMRTLTRVHIRIQLPEVHEEEPRDIMDPAELRHSDNLESAVLSSGISTADEDGKQQPVRNTKKAIGRNDPCPCGSGKKYKKCCGRGK
uniref:preprotein translocase subunit SecA n=2 Tax=Desulfovibrio sp. An276 TaxID=1965618 RepID=UPI0011863D33|nr:preprotein translocase subunit SecA [Desulfovibrio sp. An276]